MQIYVFEHDVKSIEAVDDGTDKRIRFNGEPGVTLCTLWVSKETARALQTALDKLYPVEDDVVNAVDAYAEEHAGDAGTVTGTCENASGLDMMGDAGTVGGSGEAAEVQEGRVN